jgi:hypothetical protein
VVTQLQELFVELLKQELSCLSVSPQNIDFADASRKDQLVIVSEKWKMSMYLEGELSKYWLFELHFGLFEGQSQHYLYAANELDWVFLVSRKGEAGEQLKVLISQAVERLVKPSRMKNSAPWPTSHWFLLPRGFRAQSDARDNEVLAISHEKSEEVVARYYFRDFSLYRSSKDELFFEERKWLLVPIPTHSIEPQQRQNMTPNQWSQLLGAWVSKDFFMNFGYLVEDNSQFRQWGKGIMKIPSKYSWLQRSDWRAGLTHWLTKKDVEVKTFNRAKWSPAKDSPGN